MMEIHIQNKWQIKYTFNSILIKKNVTRFYFVNHWYRYMFRGLLIWNWMIPKSV